MIDVSVPIPGKWSLFFKFILSISFIIVITIVSASVIFILKEQNRLKEELQQKAGLLLDTLEHTLSDPLYYMDVNFMSDIMEVLGEDTNMISSGRVYDAVGRIIADAYAESNTYNMEIDPFGSISIGLPTFMMESKIVEMRIQGVYIATGAILFGLIIAWNHRCRKELLNCWNRTRS